MVKSDESSLKGSSAGGVPNIVPQMK